MTGASRCIAALLLLCVVPTGYAHKASDSFLRLNVDGDVLTGRWDIALRDLDYAIGLDSDGDGALTWGEVRIAEPAIGAYALARLTVLADDAACPATVTGLQIVDHSDGKYAALLLSGRCPSPPKTLTLRYALMFEYDAQHRGLLNLERDGQSQSGVFAPDRRELRFADANSSWRELFGNYFSEGVWHVWLGADHMLFLAGLFLPAVLRRNGFALNAGWQPAVALGPALRETAVLVTAFTIAHAITLALAATGVFKPPSRIVESLVAASVIFAGLNNLLPMIHRRLWLLAAGFGLIHGAAIAGALLDLGLPTSGRVWALLAFNLGVELAQLALVAVVVPLAWQFRHSAVFRNAVLIPGSILVTLAGLGWLLQRAVGLPIGMPF